MSDSPMLDILTLLANGKSLHRDLATRGFQIIMNGGATPAQMAAFLMGLRAKGETVDEITAGAVALRARAQHFTSVPNAIDTCGTGGDARGTYNISTAVAFVLAACGVPVVKHGNRSVSSLSGSADVLTVLGVNVNAEPAVMERCLRECNLCFLLATRFHPAMRHIAPVRQELAFRTIFNLLGPLANPAAPKRQLLGVYAASWVEPLAQVLKELGVERAWVVHGSDGLDELTITGPSTVAALENGEIRRFDITPEEAGLARASLEELKGQSPEHNAKALRDAISGMESAYRRAIVLNAAAALIVAEKAADVKQGAEMAQEAIDSGAAHLALKRLVELSNERL